MYKRGENLKETLRIDMTKIREKNTNWYATILGFFRDEDTENEQDSGYEEWKKENADIINLKEIANLEKMLEHKDRNKSKNKEYKFEYVNGSLECTSPYDSEEQGILYQQGIREHVCEILEGGTIAFKNRERKYHIK